MSRIRAALRADDGAAIVEFAIVASLFLVLLWGILSYGAIFATKQAMAHAASEGALAAVSATDGDGEAHARAVIGAQLDWLRHFGFDPATSVSVDMDVLCHGSDPSGPRCVRVEVTHGWRGSDAVIPPIAQVATPESLTEYAVVKRWE